jgi:hypothetical protein
MKITPQAEVLVARWCIIATYMIVVTDALGHPWGFVVAVLSVFGALLFASYLEGGDSE